MKSRRVLQKYRNVFKTFFAGGGEAYTLVLLGMVAAASYLITGGLLPAIEQNPLDAEHVEIDDTSATSDKENLQLVNIGIKLTGTLTPTETPVPTDAPTPTTGLGTPTPTPRPTRTPTPTRRPNPPTPTSVTACLNNTAIDLVVDLSYSMRNNGKDLALRTALEEFRKSLRTNTRIAIQVFGSPDSYSGGAESRLPFVRYGANPDRVKAAISGLIPGALGGTYMKAGFEEALPLIDAEKEKRPGYRYVTIIFSDGVPEVSGATDDACVAEVGNPGTSFYRCFAKAQDPRRFGLDTDMKELVNKVYSVAIYDDTPGTEDAALISSLSDLLKDIASGRSAPYYQTTTVGNPAELTPIFKSIVNGICQ